MNSYFDWLVFSAIPIAIVLMLCIAIGSLLPVTKYVLYMDNNLITTCHSKSFFSNGFIDCDNGMNYMNYTGQYKIIEVNN